MPTTSTRASARLLQKAAQYQQEGEALLQKAEACRFAAHELNGHQAKQAEADGPAKLEAAVKLRQAQRHTIRPRRKGARRNADDLKADIQRALAKGPLTPTELNHALGRVKGSFFATPTVREWMKAGELRRDDEGRYTLGTPK